jgi:hypothetical protein
MALIKFDGENHSTCDTWVVAVYERGQEYGGPEEGGWWYTTRELVAVQPVSDCEEGVRVADELKAGEYRTRDRSYTSVNYSGGDYSMYIIEPGDKIVHKDPLERPVWS